METAITQPDRQDRQDLEEAGKLGFGIYKFGQGYWVRMMTAVFAGILILAGAAWAWSRLSAATIPVSQWVFPVSKVSGDAAAGSEVTLFKGRDALATAKVDSLMSQGGSGVLRLKSLVLNKGKSLLDADRAELPGAAFTASVGRPESVYLFQRIYLQAGAALAIILVGGVLIYRFVASNPRTADFLISTDGEMKKVNWSTRKIIQDSTSVVIGATFLIAGFIFMCDFLLSKFFMIIKVLQS